MKTSSWILIAYVAVCLTGVIVAFTAFVLA